MQNHMKTIYPKDTVHERQSGVNEGLICLRRADLEISLTQMTIRQMTIEYGYLEKSGLFQIQFFLIFIYIYIVF